MKRMVNLNNITHMNGIKWSNESRQPHIYASCWFISFSNVELDVGPDFVQYYWLLEHVLDNERGR